MKTAVSGQFAAIRVGIPFFNFNKAKHINSIRLTCNPYIYCTVLGISFKHPRMEKNPKSFQTNPKFLEFSVVARSQAKKKNGIQEMFGISNVTALDWMEHYGFPSGSVTGRARGRRIFTGRKILDWVESLR